MQIYLATSWRNQYTDRVLRFLRGAGYEVYDFRDANAEFAWENSNSDFNGSHRRAALATNEADDAFENDQAAIEGADALVLLLPCGRSAHIEAGVAIGAGTPTFILDLEGVAEPELMHKFADGYFLSPAEVVSELQSIQAREAQLDAPVFNMQSRMSNLELERMGVTQP